MRFGSVLLLFFVVLSYYLSTGTDTSGSTEKYATITPVHIFRHCPLSLLYVACHKSFVMTELKLTVLRSAIAVAPAFAHEFERECARLGHETHLERQQVSLQVKRAL